MDELLEIAAAIDAAPRTGADVDSPEGARVVALSDTFARQLAERLRRISERHEAELAEAEMGADF